MGTKTINFCDWCKDESSPLTNLEFSMREKTFENVRLGANLDLCPTCQATLMKKLGGRFEAIFREHPDAS